MPKVITAEEAIGRILGHEGGYVNNPKDPGGETNWGIAKRSYPTLDIKALTRDQAIAIYKRDFWNQCGQGLATGVMFQVLDASVNHGIGNGVRMLQRAVGVLDDGHWGPMSLAAYAKMDVSDVLMIFLAERGEFMAKLSTFDTFGKGWLRRICLNLRFAAQDN